MDQGSSPDRWARVRALYEAADEAADPSAILEAADPDLRLAVEALLRAGNAVEPTFLDPPNLSTAVRVALADERPPTHRRLGETIGPYRLDGVLGEGGMGVVYRATDTRVGRTVAVKLVRSPVAAPDLLRRFDAERQILARLDHPGIARLYDLGTAPDGAPFLVMEVVDGEPITTWADRSNASIRERVALMEDVAQAVAFAQQRLVVHRDLKPSNIFVCGGPNETPTVKLLDFGVARLVDSHPGQDALTGTGWVPMTPSYAAPEQFVGEPATTATDVYSLGVILYELLVGRRPYETTGRSAAEVERLVTSTRHGLPSEAAGLPAECRRHLRGDLDTICLKSLAPDPARRYASAADLAADLRSHLDGRPVSARPDSLGYLARSFVRRHRVGVTAAMLVGLAVVAGLVGTAWQARAAAIQRDRAEREVRVSQRVSGFLQEMLAAPDPSVGGREVRVADLLDRAAASLDTGLVDDPAAAAALRQTLGVTYRGLGLYDEAEPLLRQALSDRRRLRPGPDSLTASVLSDLAYVLRLQGRLAEADTLGREALAHVRTVFGENHVRTATALNDLAATARDRGDLRNAEALMRRVLVVDRALLDPDDLDLAIDYANLASVLADLGRPADAEPLMRRALAIEHRAAGGAPNPSVALGTGMLASILADLGRLREAELLYRQALAMRQDLLGPDHPGTLYTQAGLARVLTESGRPEAALPLVDQSVAGLQAALGPAHLRIAQALAGRAAALREAGRVGAALESYAASARMWAEASPDHPGRADALVAYGRLLVVQGETARAAPMLREAVRIRTAAFGAQHPKTIEALSALRGSPPR